MTTNFPESKPKLNTKFYFKLDHHWDENLHNISSKYLHGKPYKSMMKEIFLVYIYFIHNSNKKLCAMIDSEEIKLPQQNMNHPSYQQTTMLPRGSLTLNFSHVSC